MGVVSLPAINSRLCMCSLPTAMSALNEKTICDQYGRKTDMSAVVLVCVASDTVCKQFNLHKNVVQCPMRDLPDMGDEFIEDRVTAAIAVVNSALLSGKTTVVFCNQGRNRAPFVCVMYAMKHGNKASGCVVKYVRRENSGRGKNILTNREFLDYISSHTYIHLTKPVQKLSFFRRVLRAFARAA